MIATRAVPHGASPGTGRRVHILGVPVDAVTLSEACRLIAGRWRAGEASPRMADPTEDAANPTPWHVVTVNPELIMAAQRDERVMTVLRRCALVVADGVGVVWAARKLRSPVPERVPGVDLARLLLAEAAKQGRRVYLLGGEEGVAAEAARRLTSQEPHLQVVGVRHGFFDSTESEEIVAEIASLDVDLLLVGLGAPKQELWIAQHRERLGAKVMIGVGGALDVFAGRVKRAPVAWRKAGLEWAYRLLSQPRRARRMLSLPRFVVAVLREKGGARP